MNRVALLVALCAGTFSFSGPARAQDATVAQQLAEFRYRIDSLERENAELRQAMTVPEGTRYAALAPPPLPAAGAGPHLDGSNTALPPSEAWTPSEPWAPPMAESLNEPCEECESKGQVIGSDLSMTAEWKHGMELATKSRDFRVHVGGRTQFDVGWFDADPNVEDNINVPYENGVDFRRARLRVDGTMYGFIEWAAEYDFVNAIRIDGVDRAVTAPTDLWVIFNEMPCGNVRVGNQKPAIGFEHLVSSRFLPFMERSYNQDSFYGGGYNGFWPGVSVFDAYGEDQEGGTWNIGVFKPTDNVFAASAHDGDYAVVARGTKLLWYCDEGASLMHVGVSACSRRPWRAA